jgi:hypothetical protein
VDGGDFQFSWNPPLQPSHYPTDETDSLSVNAVGRLNTVDTAAQGLAPIQPAYKPGVKVVLTSGQPGAPMTFGGQYTVSAAKDSKADNVGITPLILKKSTLTTYTFGVTFTSTPVSQDGTDINRDGKVDGGDLAIWQQNYDPLGLNVNIPPMGDCNADGKIDGGDLALWQQHYNPIGILSLPEAQPLVSKTQPAGTLPISEPVALDAPALGTPATLDVATPAPVLLADELAPRAQWGSTVTHSELLRTPAPAQPDDALGLLEPLQFEPLLT